MTVGATWRAMRNTWRTPSSDSPSHLVKISGPSTAMKLTPHSLANALASSVLPGPGGPHHSAPTRGGGPPAGGRGRRFRRGRPAVLRQPLLAAVEPADVAPGDVRNADQG